MRVVLLLVCLAWGVGGIGVAAAESPPSRPATGGYPGVQALLKPDGTGQLFASTDSRDWSWQACTGSAPLVCDAFGRGNPIDSGDPPAGTFFVATLSDGRSVRSPVWEGTVQAARPPTTQPPAVSGSISANSYVTPVPALWTGGWEGDFDQTQLAACASPDGTDCTSLTDPEFEPFPGSPPPCANGAAVIDPVFTGWYLRVADTLYGAGTAFAGVGHSSPYDAPVWEADPLTAVALVGRIANATGPRTVRCGAVPLPPNADPHHPRWCSAGQPPRLSCSTVIVTPRGGVEVWCVMSRCHVSITATRRRMTLRYRASVLGLAHLTLRPRLIARLGHGRALLKVDINGRPEAARHIRL